LARRRKRKSRRRQEGRRILECVPQYNIESGEDKPVTAARKFIHAQGIVPPALLLVRRNEHTTDRYFWAEKGLFGAQYVEENHFLFPSLKGIIEAKAAGTLPTPVVTAVTPEKVQPVVVGVPETGETPITVATDATASASFSAEEKAQLVVVGAAQT
jgi:hypothetical protein